MSKVITIDEEVRCLLDEFVSLYATFEQAATAINVNRSTIAVYMQGAHTVPAGQLREIIRIVRRRLSPERIDEIFLEGWEDRIMAGAHQHDFLHQDESAYRLNEELIRLLEFFASYYPNRNRAAEALAIGPAEYHDYVKGNQRSLPRSIFERVVEILATEHRVDENTVCDALAFTSFDSVLKPADRESEDQVSAGEAIDALIRVWQQPDEASPQQREMADWCRHEYGSIAKAALARLPVYLDQYEERGQAAIADGRVDEVLGFLDQILTAARWLTVQLQDAVAIGDLKESEQFQWATEVRKVMAVHNRLRDLLFREAPFSHQFMAKNEVQKLMFRYRHLKDVREYTPSTVYRPGELIFHPMFGVGRVTRLQGHHKVGVRFTETDHEVVLSIGT